MKKKLLTLFAIGICSTAFGQYAAEYDSGMVVKLNESGSKYFRLLLWGQSWFQDYEGTNANDGLSLRRGRLLAYSQVNKRFMVLTHFGVNSITHNNMTPMGKSDDVQLFLHEMFMQFNVNDNLAIGSGLHFYGGISRLNGQGTINMLTIDNNRSSWSTLGLSDMFASHLGIFAKGRLGKLNYRLSLSDAAVNTLDGNGSTVLNPGDERYLGKALTGKGKYLLSGYFDYQFLDQESNALSYRVGSYLGGKKVFNLGAGFLNHSDAIARNENDVIVTDDVRHFALDVFYDAPLGGRNASVTAYAKFQNSKMGQDYIQGNVVGDGNQFYAHLGYLLPKCISEGVSKAKNRFQPYAAYSHRDFNALPVPAKELKLGSTWYIDGHNARISVEYQKNFHSPVNMDDMITVQAMILL